MSETNTSAPSRDDFASMLEASLAGRDLMEGTVVRGTVTAVLHDTVVIDVGLKTEGRVALREFTGPGSEAPKLGDQVDIYLERIENAMGEAVLSRDKARREEAWDRLEKTFESKEPVNGAIVGRVKGGFTVDLGGASAFLPGSQVDIRPVRDVAPLMNKEQPFAILKMDRPRGNIVSPAALSWKNPAPSSALSSSVSWPKAKCVKASSRTSPITVRSWIWAALTACCTSPT